MKMHSFIFFPKVKAKTNQQQLEHLEKLKDLDIDLTSYLVSSLSIPDRHVQIVNKSGLPNKEIHSNIHFHE